MSPETVFTISPSNDSTVVLELVKTGPWRRRKHHLFFENFSGELFYVAERPESSRVNLVVDAASVVCRDQWLTAKKRQVVTRYAREDALAAGQHPEIAFASTRVSEKPVRGFVVEGVLKVRGIGRTVKVNIALNKMQRDKLQIDGDTSFRLTDFGIKPPSSFFGLIRTKDEAVLCVLLWATPSA